jgi:hypothetical protein
MRWALESATYGAYACIGPRRVNGPPTIASFGSIGRASMAVGTTRAANRDGRSPGLVVCLAWVAGAFEVAVSACRLWLDDRDTSGFPLGITTVQIPMLGKVCDRPSTAPIRRSRRGPRPRQTICIAGPLKSPPTAPPGTPSRSPRCHPGSVISAPRSRTRDRNGTALVAVEGLQQFTSCMIPRSRRDVPGSALEAPLGTPS